MNLKYRPLVSIIITSYNYGKYINEAIESALSQDYPNIEIIVSDNCSTDQSVEVIRRYTKDSRIKFNQNKNNIGVIANFIKAISLANGDYVTFISADDYWVNNSFVSQAIKRFESVPSLMIVKGKNLFKYEKTGKYIEDATYIFWKKYYYNKSYINGDKVFLEYPSSPSVGFGGSIYNKSALMATGLDKYDDKCFYMDAEISLKILLMGDISFINEDTYVNRLHGANSTGNRTARQAIENITYIESTYQYAIEDKKIPMYILEKWRHTMLSQYFRGILKHFYIHSKPKYIEVKEYLNVNHYKVYEDISNSLNWKIFLIASKSKFIIKIYPFLGRIKCHLHTIFRNITS